MYTPVNVVFDHVGTIGTVEQIIAIRLGIHAYCIGQASRRFPVLVALFNILGLLVKLQSKPVVAIGGKTLDKFNHVE